MCLDNLLNTIIQESKNLYGEEYQKELQNQVDTLESNITLAREILSSAILYSDKGLSSKEVIENATTFVSNALLIPMLHYNEVYLAKAKTSNRYEEHNEEVYECIKGDGQIFDLNSGSKLSFKFSFDYDEFVKKGKNYIDNKEVPRDKYTLSKGSTIVTFNDDYTKSLSSGMHSITAQIDDNKVDATFNIENNITEKVSKNNNDTTNPKTGDNIYKWLKLMVISITLISLSIIYIKKILKGNK